MTTPASWICWYRWASVSRYGKGLELAGRWKFDTCFHKSKTCVVETSPYKVLALCQTWETLVVATRVLRLFRSGIYVICSCAPRSEVIPMIPLACTSPESHHAIASCSTWVGAVTLARTRRGRVLSTIAQMSRDMK